MLINASVDRVNVNRFEMSDPMTQLVVLGVIALVVILMLRNVLGTRTGFEPTEVAKTAPSQKPEFEVVEGGLDRDISDYVGLETPTGKALVEIKKIEPEFSVSEFMNGARQAYEIILMAFEGDDQETLSQFLSQDVFDSFVSVIDARQAKGLSVSAEFVGVSEVKLLEAEFDKASNTGELTIQFVGELTSEVIDANGKVVEGDKKKVKRQKDVWTFAREVGSDDPNWQLVATGA